MAITTADIHTAADRIAESGQQPTLAAVRSALGGGSFTTISEAMKGWKAAQAAAAAPLREAAPAAHWSSPWQGRSHKGRPSKAGDRRR